MTSLAPIPPGQPWRHIFDAERARIFQALPVSARRFYHAIEGAPDGGVTITFMRPLDQVYLDPDRRFWIDARYQIVDQTEFSLTVRKR